MGDDRMVSDGPSDIAAHRRKTFNVKVCAPEVLRRHNTSTNDAVYQHESLSRLRISHSTKLSFPELYKYLCTHAFNEVVVQLTFGPLWNLQVIADGPHAGRLRHLTIVVDTSTFDTSHCEGLTDMLKHALEKLDKIKTLGVKLDGYDERMNSNEALLAILDALPTTSHWIEEVRLELTSPRQLQKLLNCFTETKYPGRSRTKWTVNWTNLKMVHIGVPHWFIRSMGDVRIDAIDGSPSIFDHPRHNQVLSNLILVHPPIKSVSAYRRIGKNITRPTPFLIHESANSGTSRKLLTSVRGLRQLFLQWHNADVQAILDLIKNNRQTLQDVMFSVELRQPGTWDQVFHDLRSCNLLSIMAFNADSGFHYSTSAGTVETGYLVPGYSLTDVPVLRWKDRYQLAVLLRQVRTNCTKEGFAEVPDPCWTSVIDDYREYSHAKAEEEEQSWSPDPALGFQHRPIRRRALCRSLGQAEQTMETVQDCPEDTSQFIECPDPGPNEVVAGLDETDSNKDVEMSETP